MSEKNQCNGGTAQVYCHYEKQVIQCRECWPCAECDPCAWCDEDACPYSSNLKAGE